ncbi:MAG: energy transducer TonB family protein [Rickettsiales bacterium]
MNWGLTQGLLGAKRLSLAPSARAIGPNIYLSRTDFLRMLGIAFAVHLLVIGIAAVIPSQKVTDIPVRALSFKLGDRDRTAAYNPIVAIPVQPAAAEPIAAPIMKAVSTESWRATPNITPPVVPAPLKPMHIAPKPKVVKVAEQPKPVLPAPTYQPTIAQPPAIAPAPQQYVRQVGGAPDGAIGGEGNVSTMTPQTAQAIRSKYELEISGWIQRHKLYPASAGGREGRAIVRVRIDRVGNVRYFAIEQSAGMQALDDAALDMIRRANPLPAVPVNYPAGNLVEFLIPITFKAPQ